MSNTKTKSSLFPNKNKIEKKPEFNNTESNLIPNLQTSKQNLLSGNEYIINN